METLNYSIEINAPREKVWDIMLSPDTYKRWAKAFAPNSQFEGNWEKGAYMSFIAPGMGGTRAIMDEYDRPARLQARHTEIIDKDGSFDTESEPAKKWIGSTETYTFTNLGDITKLDVEIKTHKDYKKMNDGGWPEALNLLKNLCEK